VAVTALTRVRIHLELTHVLIVYARAWKALEQSERAMYHIMMLDVEYRSDRASWFFLHMECTLSCKVIGS
jgi:hypothetical protein